jgi:transposase
MNGRSLGQIAKTFSISRATVARIINKDQEGVSKGISPALLQVNENRPPETAA